MYIYSNNIYIYIIFLYISNEKFIKKIILPISISDIVYQTCINNYIKIEK